MTITVVPSRSIRIAIDRGGTFTDVHASIIDPAGPDGRSEFVIKLLSQDPSNYRDAPVEGIRRVLERVTGEELVRGQPLPIEHLGKFQVFSTWLVAHHLKTMFASPPRSRPTPSSSARVRTTL
jgi:5-oxoprolinase (ATP-hydrolysing)